jgi:hypothetical protein
MLKMRIIFFFCFIISSLISLNVVAVDTQSKYVILNNYEQYIKDVNIASFSSEISWKLQGENESFNVLKNFKIDFIKHHFWQNSPTINGKKMNYDESIFLSNKYIFVSSLIDENSSNSDIGIISNSSISDKLWGETVGLQSLAFPFGYLHDKEKFLSIYNMLISNDTQMTQQQDGSIKFQGITQEYAFIVYLLPEKKYVAKELFFKRLKTTKNIGDFVSIKYVVDSFTEIDKKWFPNNYRCIINYPSGTTSIILPEGAQKNSPEMKKLIDKTSQNIPERMILEKVSFSDISFPTNLTENNIKISIKIPNGTPVSMQNAPQIQYVWMDGKIVVKTDEVALAIARGGHKFIPGPDQPRFWMMALGIIMMLVGGGLKLRDMLKES